MHHSTGCAPSRAMSYAERAELLGAGENTLSRLPGRVVARVTRPGQLAAARKEVLVSCWLQSLGLPVVQALDDLVQPVEVDGRAVTFWRELPPHRYGTLTEFADTPRLLHCLPPDGFTLPPVTPFVRLRERIAAASTFRDDDRARLLDHLDTLERRYLVLPSSGAAGTGVEGIRCPVRLRRHRLGRVRDPARRPGTTQGGVRGPTRLRTRRVPRTSR